MVALLGAPSKKEISPKTDPSGMLASTLSPITTSTSPFVRI
jgi:hypothetical protein